MKYEKVAPGYTYHIYNQGNNGNSIFFEARNYGYFLELLKKYILPITQIYAYCLLTNHFHLLLRINDDVDDVKCAQSFSNFFNAYAKAINKSQERTGSLFKRKFARIRVENELYLKRLVLYIHTNAQHHGIVTEFQNYPHSSYHAYLSSKQTNISKDFVLGLFDDLNNFVFLHKVKSAILDEDFDELMLE